MCRFFSFRFYLCGLLVKIYFNKKYFFGWVNRVEVNPFCKSYNYLLIFIVFIWNDFPSTIRNSSPVIRFSIHTFIRIKIDAFRFTFIIFVFRKFKILNLSELAKSMFKKVSLIICFQNDYFVIAKVRKQSYNWLKDCYKIFPGNEA